MNLVDFASKIHGHKICGPEETDIEGVYIGDLLSLVMGKAKAAGLWVTVQGHLNIIAVASLVEIRLIVVVEDMDVSEDTLKKAQEEGVAIIKTPQSAYDVAKVCVEMGLS